MWAGMSPELMQRTRVEMGRGTNLVDGNRKMKRPERACEITRPYPAEIPVLATRLGLLFPCTHNLEPNHIGLS